MCCEPSYPNFTTKLVPPKHLEPKACKITAHGYFLQARINVFGEQDFGSMITPLGFTIKPLKELPEETIRQTTMP